MHPVGSMSVEEEFNSISQQGRQYGVPVTLLHEMESRVCDACDFNIYRYIWSIIVVE